MNRKMVIATLLSFVTVLNAMALNWETASGSDIVRENAAKEEGFTDAQLQNICKRLGNREIEFVNGKVEEVSRDGESGVVTMLVEFSDPAAGEFASTLSVEVLLTGEMAKQAESLDNGTKIPSIRGYLTYDKDFFCNIQLKNVSFALPKSAKKTNVIDLNKVTGADIVHENATKEHGYSESQLRKLCESLKGRSLEFENGKVSNVYKYHDGTVTMLVSFSDSGRHRMFSHDLSIDAILDGEMAKLAETLDRETKILKLSGNVFYDPDSISFSFMKLENVVFTPEASALNKSVVDYSKATGPQLVAENASKKGGYSDAQFSNICRLLDGREITFTNGIVEDVSKDTRTGGTTLRVDFKQPGTSGFSPTIRVSAHLAESVERKVEALDKGTLIASLTGNVAYDSSSTHSMTLNKAMVVVDLTETAVMTFDPNTVTGADIVKANAAKEDGFSKAQLASICKQLKGRVLTFENVEIRSVSKDKRRDGIRVLLSASTTPGGRRLTFWAYVSGDMAAEVEKLDIGTKVKRVRGTVSYDSSFNIVNWFNLINASFDLWQDCTKGDGMTKDLSEAVNKFRKSAELGDVNAQKSLGICYAKGEGVEKDMVEAVKWFRKAADQGDPVAQSNLGLCYNKGNGVEKDPVEAVKWYCKAAEQGNVKAQNALGVCYWQGDGVKKDLVEAVKWFRKAADQGDPVAQCILGKCYSEGVGVAKDPKEGAKWLLKSAEQGYADAQYSFGGRLGAGYTLGKGKEEDQKEAAKWLRKAAEQGHAKAQARLGTLYLHGIGMNKDVVEATKWYRKAIDQGQSVRALCLYLLANCYDRGYDVAQNIDEATRWYRKAAEQGHAGSQFKLGLRYENGEGVVKDQEEAIKWYRKAAEQNDRNAQCALARCYETGRGVPSNVDEAVNWYRKAAKYSHEARKALQRLGKEP